MNANEPPYFHRAVGVPWPVLTPYGRELVPHLDEAGRPLLDSYGQPRTVSRAHAAKLAEERASRESFQRVKASLGLPPDATGEQMLERARELLARTGNTAAKGTPPAPPARSSAPAVAAPAYTPPAPPAVPSAPAYDPNGSLAWESWAAARSDAEFAAYLAGIALTPEDLHVARQMGTDPGALLAAKHARMRAQRGAAREYLTTRGR